ncbi:DUF3080 family protein [Pokkaliibacter sp. CJK22405]|uniref:DUF3080 family protein n=1 Tax=Pokkaliibacter sp. CJK22405 TaxID=3384615 RepID=UPI0039851B97
MGFLSRPIPRIVLFPLLLTLSGCSGSADDYFDDFESRIRRPLQSELAENDIDHPPPSWPAYPERRHRLQPVADIREGVIDVLAYRRCNMLELIAERNSILGKVAPFSQRLLYELRFIDQGSHCLPSLNEQDEAEQEFRQQLQRVLNIKRAHLPERAIDLVYNSEEVEHQFSLAVDPLDFEQPLQAFPPVLAALDTLIRAMDEASQATKPGIFTHSITSAELEEALATLHHQQEGARLLASMRLVTRHLESNAAIINQRLDTQAVCTDGPNTTSRIMQNVFFRYYADPEKGIQPYLAAIYKGVQEWRSRWLALQEKLPLPPVLNNQQNWLWSESEGYYGRYLRAQQAHTTAWQRLLKECQQMPGSNN